MADLSESETQRACERFAELGAETVRQLLSTDGFPQGWRLIAMRWLSSSSAPAREPVHEKREKRERR
jgi:hypothetical protein